jgi:hypothetical protein
MITPMAERFFLYIDILGFKELINDKSAVTPLCQGSCPLLYFSLIFRWAD